MLVLVGLLTACADPPPYKQQSYVFGTLVEVSIQGVEVARARQVADQILRDFDALHRQLHPWEPGPMERVNQAIARATPGQPARINLPTGLAPLLRDAAQHAERSDHLFNPAIGNLVRLWGFHADEYRPRQPAEADIRRLVAARPRLSDLGLEGDRLVASNPAVRVDLGGYAKGHALDLAAATLRREGVKNALVNIGGNIIALGQRGDRPWRVGIQHPRRAGALASLELRDGEAIGTSGDYQRYFELDGRRYCHLIDPRSGWPVQGVQAVTVLVRGPGAGVLSDVASKPLFVSGPDGWRAMATRLGIGAALLVDGGGRVQVTAPLASRLRWEDNAATYTVVP